MKRAFVTLGVLAMAMGIAIGCTQAAPPPTPTKAAAVPTKAAEPTKPAAAPTAAPAPQPTAAPAKKVDFPQKGKAFTLTVGFAAGGGSDRSTRLLAPALEKELGIPVEVLNRVGANGQLALTELVQSKPDGYTASITHLPPVITTYLDPRRKAIFGRKDLLPLALQLKEANAISVKADSPYRTLKDLIDAAKANPEKVKAAATGIGTTPHIAILMTEGLTGTKFATVQLEGDAGVTAGLLGGHVDAAFLSSGVLLPQVKGGAVRMLGMMDKQRSKFYPDVPTTEEQGYKLYTVSTRGISGPAGIPKDVMDVLSTALKKAMDNEEYKTKMRDSGWEPIYEGPAEYAAFWDDMEAQIKPLMEIILKAG